MRCETKHVLDDDDAWCNRPQAVQVKYDKATGGRAARICTQKRRVSGSDLAVKSGVYGWWLD